MSNHYRTHEGALPRVGGISEALDVALLEMPSEFALPDLPLAMTSAGCVYSQQALFLGFPFGSRDDRAVYRVSAIRQGATVSASENVADGQLWYLDGLNNPGFSGGPVVFAPPEKSELQLMAVVSGYRRDWEHLHVDGVGQRALTVSTNSGNIHAYDVFPIRRILEARHGAV